MAFTTLTALVNALDAMTVSGVVKSHASPPNQMSTAELPLKFIGFPSEETPIISFDSTLGLRTASIELITLIAPVLHNTNRVNFPLTILLMDNIHTALKDNALLLGLDRWTSVLDTNQVGDTTYWSITTTIFVSG